MLSLSTSIKLKAGVLEYRYLPESGAHIASYKFGCSKDWFVECEFCPGKMINHLNEFKDESPEVEQLIRWLGNPHKWQR